MKIICSFKFFKYFLILFLFIPVFLFSEGFFSGTLVKSEFGSIPIEQLQVGDWVFAFDHISSEYSLQPVTHCSVCFVDKYCKLSFKNYTVSCALDQCFFSASSGQWVRAQELCVSDLLQAAQGMCVEVERIQQINQRIMLYSITVAGQHNFSVTSADLYAHNMIPVVLIGAAWAFGGGIQFLGLSAAVAAIGITFGITAFKKKSGGFKTTCTVTPTSSAPAFGGGFPEDPDKNGRNRTKVNNMQEFFQTKFGSEIKDKLRKTNKIQQGQTVYEVIEDMHKYGLRKGDFFYLDALHKDHFEVFSKRGVAKMIITIDGIEKEITFAKGNRIWQVNCCVLLQS